MFYIGKLRALRKGCFLLSVESGYCVENWYFLENFKLPSMEFMGRGSKGICLLLTSNMHKMYGKHAESVQKACRKYAESLRKVCGKRAENGSYVEN